MDKRFGRIGRKFFSNPIYHTTYLSRYLQCTNQKAGEHLGEAIGGEHAILAGYKRGVRA